MDLKQYCLDAVEENTVWIAKKCDIRVSDIYLLFAVNLFSHFLTFSSIKIQG